MNNSSIGFPISSLSLSELEKVHVARIPDCEVEAIVLKDAQRGVLDNSYYSNMAHGTIDIEDAQTVRHYKEWANGYFATVVKKTSDAATAPTATVFVDLHYGDWAIMRDYADRPEFLGDLVALGGESAEWLAHYRGQSSAVGPTRQTAA